MAAPIVYGQVEVQRVDGKTKLLMPLSTKVKLTVNKFDQNNEVYVNINSRAKSISMSCAEYQDLCLANANLSEKVHLLEPNSLQGQFIYHGQLGQMLSVNGPRGQAYGAAQGVQGQGNGLVHGPQGQAHGPAHGPVQGQAHGQIHMAAPNNDWDEFM